VTGRAGEIQRFKALLLPPLREMKIIKKTRYVLQPKNKISLFLIRLLSDWVTPIETKHFLFTKHPKTQEDIVVEFCEVHAEIKPTDLMHLFPDKYKELVPTGHKHFGLNSYYPGG
jgi:hypothetical protein